MKPDLIVLFQPLIEDDHSIELSAPLNINPVFAPHALLDVSQRAPSNVRKISAFQFRSIKVISKAPCSWGRPNC